MATSSMSELFKLTICSMRKRGPSSLFVPAVGLFLHVSVVKGFSLPMSSSRKLTKPLSARRGDSWASQLIPENSSQHIRVVSRTGRGSGQSFDVQTAVNTFERKIDGKKQVIELHAQLHFGSQEYFDYFNSNDFNIKFDKILYELLVDESLMDTPWSGDRILRKRRDGSPVLMASPSDQNTAQQYGLSCQVDVVDYTQPYWVHADYTRQEFLQESNDKKRETLEPRWALASTQLPGVEALSALVRPSTPSTSLSSPVARRLFSNLFLPGNNLAALLRALLWLSLPSPELSVMVLDWSSILPRPTGGVSAVALPVLECILTGNIQQARQLVFGQMVVNSERSGGNDALLVKKRNENAMTAVERVLNKSDDNQRLALLYGGMHCNDLTNRLKSFGFVQSKTTQWRTAWSVQVPNFGNSASNGSSNPFAAMMTPEAVAIGLVVLPLYLTIGGADWIATLHDTAQSLEAGNYFDATLEVLLYLARHVLLYVGLAKFVVDWDGTR